MTGAKHEDVKQVTEKGFTLVELLVAAALGVLVLAAAVTLVGRGLTVWQRTDARLQQLFLVEKGLDMLGRELRNGVALADLPFEGSSEGLSFASGIDDSHLSQIRYTLEPAGSFRALVRETQPFPAGDQPPVRKALIPGIRSFSLQYATLKEPSPGEKSFSWSDTWTAGALGTRMPKLLQLRMETVDARGAARSIVREYRVPHGAFGSAVE